MSEAKNPYRELAQILRALPEGRRVLIVGKIRGVLSDDPETVCGCAFGMAYPNAGELVGRNNLDDVYVEGTLGETDDTRPEDRFRSWVDSINGTAGFVDKVMLANDEFRQSSKEVTNSRPVAEARYEYMLMYLDRKAEEYAVRNGEKR